MIDNMINQLPPARENKEQQFVFEWAWSPARAQDYPEAHLLYANPNGAWLKNVRHAVFMKRQGLKPGVFDMFLPVAIHSPQLWLPGMYIELKATDGTISKKQVDFAKAAQSQGYVAKICWGHQEVIKEIKLYLDLREREIINQLSVMPPDLMIYERSIRGNKTPKTMAARVV